MGLEALSLATRGGHNGVRSFVFLTEGLIPTSSRGAFPNLSRTKSLDSLESQVSIPLPEKAGRRWGVGRNPVLLSLLWVKLTGNTIPSPPPSGCSSYEHHPQGQEGRVESAVQSESPGKGGGGCPFQHLHASLNGHFDVLPGPATPPCHRCALPADPPHLGARPPSPPKLFSRVPGRFPQHPTLSLYVTSISDGDRSSLRLGCWAAPRSPAESAAAILNSSRQQPFQSAPLSRRGGSGPHLHRGLNKVKSQSSQTGRGEGGRGE